jgi:hypothetical protein
MNNNDARREALSSRNQLDRIRVRSDADQRRSQVSGFLASALIGLAVLIVGLLIVHFTPEERKR